MLWRTYRKGFLREVMSKLRSNLRIENNMAKRGAKGDLSRETQLYSKA